MADEQEEVVVDPILGEAPPIEAPKPRPVGTASEEGLKTELAAEEAEFDQDFSWADEILQITEGALQGSVVGPQRAEDVIPWFADSKGYTVERLLERFKEQHIHNLPGLVNAVGIRGLPIEIAKNESVEKHDSWGLLPAHMRRTKLRGQKIAETAAHRDVLSQGYSPESISQYSEKWKEAYQRYGVSSRDIVVSQATSSLFGTDATDPRAWGGQAFEITAPGSDAYNDALRRIHELSVSKNPDEQKLVEVREAYEKDLMGWDKYLKIVIDSRMRKYAGRDLSGDELEELRLKARQDGLKDLALFKTAGLWTAPILVPFEFDEKTGDSRIPNSSELKGANVFMPSFEIVGVNNDGQIVVRQESALTWAFQMMDIPEKMLSGMFSQKEGETLGAAALRGVAQRRNFFVDLYESDVAKSKGRWTRWPIGGLGFLLSVFTPDITSAFGLIKGKRGIENIFKYIKSVDEARPVADTSRTIARRLLSNADDFLRQAEAAEAELFKSAKGFMQEVDRVDSAISGRYEAQNADIVGDAVELDRHLPGEVRGEFIHAHPSYQKEEVRVLRQNAGTPSTERSIRFGFRQKLQRLGDMRSRLSDGLDAIRRGDALDDSAKSLLDTALWHASKTDLDKLLNLLPTARKLDLQRYVNGGVDGSSSGWSDFIVDPDRAVAALTDLATDLDDAKRVEFSALLDKIRVRANSPEFLSEQNFEDTLAFVIRAEEAVKLNKEVRAVAHLISEKLLLLKFGVTPEPLEADLLKLVEAVQEVETLSSEALRVSNALESGWNVPRKLAVALSAVIDARARTWAKHTGRDPSAWYKSRLKMEPKVKKPPEEPTPGAPTPGAPPPPTGEPPTPPIPEEPPTPPVVDSAPRWHPLPGVQPRPLVDSKGNSLTFGFPSEFGDALTDQALGRLTEAGEELGDWPLSQRELWDHLGPSSGNLASGSRAPKTAKEVAEWLSQYGGLSLTRALAARIAPLIDPTTGWTVFRARKQGERGGSWNGYFEIKKDSGRTKVKIRGPGYDQTGLTESLIIHELIHAATGVAMHRGYRAAKGSELRTVVDNLDDIGRRLEAYAEKELKGKPTRSGNPTAWNALSQEERTRLATLRHWARKSAFGKESEHPGQEVVTYGLTDPGTIELLKTITLRDLGFAGAPKISVWDRFVQLLGKMLGVAEDEHTALNYVLSETGALFRQLDPDAEDLVRNLAHEGESFSLASIAREQGVAPIFFSALMRATFTIQKKFQATESKNVKELVLESLGVRPHPKARQPVTSKGQVVTDAQGNVKTHPDYVYRNSDVKAAELEWTGLELWLDDLVRTGRTSVTRKEVQEFIEGNAANIRYIERGFNRELGKLQESFDEAYKSFEQEVNDIYTRHGDDVLNPGQRHKLRQHGSPFDALISRVWESGHLFLPRGHTARYTLDDDYTSLADSADSLTGRLMELVQAARSETTIMAASRWLEAPAEQLAKFRALREEYDDLIESVKKKAKKDADEEDVAFDDWVNDERLDGFLEHAPEILDQFDELGRLMASAPRVAGERGFGLRHFYSAAQFQEAKKAFKEAEEAADASPTKWEAYRFPGDVNTVGSGRQNYRELQVTFEYPEQVAFTSDIERYPSGYTPILDPLRSRYTYRERQAVEAEYQRLLSMYAFTPEEKTDRALAQLWDEAESNVLARPAGTHWPDDYDQALPTIAHVRFSDRQGPEGGRILLIEEIQSDYHQQGRKRGYTTEENRRILDELQQEIEVSNRVRNVADSWTGANQRPIYDELADAYIPTDLRSLLEIELQAEALGQRTLFQIVNEEPLDRELNQAQSGLAALLEAFRRADIATPLGGRRIGRISLAGVGTPLTGLVDEAATSRWNKAWRDAVESTGSHEIWPDMGEAPASYWDQPQEAASLAQLHGPATLSGFSELTPEGIVDAINRIYEANRRRIQAALDKTPTAIEATPDGLRLSRGTDGELAALAGQMESLPEAVEFRRLLAEAEFLQETLDETFSILKREAQQATDNLAGARGGPVRGAPLKKNWHEVVIKRMLRLAVDEGYEGIAFTNADAITPMIQGEPSLFGRLSQAIAENPDDFPDKMKKVHSGNQYFYDKMVPKFLQKYIRQFDGVVEELEMDFTSREAHWVRGQRFRGRDPQTGPATLKITFPYIRVTDEMEESVSEGQRLYNIPREPADEVPSINPTRAWEMEETGANRILLTSESMRREATKTDQDVGLLFEVSDDTVRVKSANLPESLRGIGLGSEMYLEALLYAARKGFGFESDINPSPDAIRVYERLRRSMPTRGEAREIGEVVVSDDGSGDILRAKQVKQPDGEYAVQYFAPKDDLKWLATYSQEELDDLGAFAVGFDESVQPPRFHSGLREAVERMPAKMQPQAVMAWLKKQPGVKTEEVEWTGLDTWLQAQEGRKSIPRQEVLDFIETNRANLIEESIQTGDSGFMSEVMAPLREVLEEQPILEATAERVARRGIQPAMIHRIESSLFDFGRKIQDLDWSPEVRESGGGYLRIDKRVEISRIITDELLRIFEETSSSPANRAGNLLLRSLAHSDQPAIRRALQILDDPPDSFPVVPTHVRVHDLPRQQRDMFYARVLQNSEAEARAFVAAHDAAMSKVDEAFDEIVKAKGIDEAQYSEHVQPGDYTNYRNFLLQMPTDTVGVTPGRLAVPGQMQLAPMRTPEARPRRYERLTEHEGYTEGHWTEPNVFAHIRVTDRTNEAGERILFVEEIQSDWHQGGRRYGYDTPEVRPAFEDYFAALRRAYIGPDGRFLDVSDSIESLGSEVQEALNRLLKIDDVKGGGPLSRFALRRLGQHHSSLNPYQDRRPKLDLADFYSSRTGIDWNRLSGETHLQPDAPLKKTWHELALRRILQLAVDEDYDAIAIPSGNMVSETVGGLEEGQGYFYDKMLPKYLAKYTRKLGGNVEPLGGERNAITGYTEALARATATADPADAVIMDPAGTLLRITDAMRDEFSTSQRLFNIPREPDTPVPPKRVTHRDSGLTVIQALEGDDVNDAIRGLARVFRRDLTEEDLSAVTTWLRTASSKLRNLHHEGGAFIADSDELVELAEELFGEAFLKYLKEGRAPTKPLEDVFSRIKDFLVRVYAAIRGRDVQLSDEMRRVFDDLLAEERVGAEELLPHTLSTIRREMLGPPEAQRAGVFSLIREELRRRGVAKLKSVEEIDQELKATGKVELPKPIFGEYFDKGAKRTLTEEEVITVQRLLVEEMGEAKEMPRRAGGPTLTGPDEAVIEVDPSEEIMSMMSKSPRFIDRLRVVASFMFFGGDSYADLRLFPPTIRQSIMAGIRPLQQLIGESIALAQEGNLDKFVALMAGELVKLKSGRDLASSGVDYMAHTQKAVNRLFRTLNTEEQEIVVTYLPRHFHRRGKATEPAMYWTNDAGKRTRFHDDNLDELIERMISRSDLGKQLKIALGVAPGQENPYQYRKAIEALLYYTGIVGRYVKDEIVNLGDDVDVDVTQVDRVRGLFGEWQDLFGKTEGGLSKTVTHGILVLNAHAAADLSRTRMAQTGLVVEEKVVNAYKDWVSGGHIDERMLPKVRNLARKMGINANFIEDTHTLGAGQYVPIAVQKRISDALARLEVRPGNKGKELFDQMIRYQKIRMTRGFFLPRQRYFTMNTFDHFTQMGITVGFGTAFASTLRLLPQNLLTFPGFAHFVAGVRKAGIVSPEAMETVRQTMQTWGDFMARIVSASKWRIDVNDVLRGGRLEGDELVTRVRLGDSLYTYQEIRRIAVEEGIFASFDTRALEKVIRSQIEEFFTSGAVNDLPKGVRAKLQQFVGFDPAKGTKEVLRKFENLVTDVAETWSERERIGAMMTLIETGMPPRAAARTTIKALYDYAGTMSEFDRKWLINLVLPFWAFQKNANKHIFDTLLSPWGAYRMGVYRRFQERSADALSYALYDGMVDPYGVDPESLPDDQKNNYFIFRAKVEDIYGGPEGVPDDVRFAMHMMFRGRDNMFQDGKHHELDAVLQEARKFTGTVAASRRRPSSADLPTYLRDRVLVKLPMPIKKSVNKFTEHLTDDEAWLAIMIPESTTHAAMRHMVYTSAILVNLGLLPASWLVSKVGDITEKGRLAAARLSVEEDQVPLEKKAQEVIRRARSPLTVESVYKTDWNYTTQPAIAEMLRQVFPVERSPIIGPALDFMEIAKSRVPRRISPIIDSILTHSPIPTFTIPALTDNVGVQDLIDSGFEPHLAKQLSTLKGKRYYVDSGMATLVFELTPPLPELNAKLLELGLELGEGDSLVEKVANISFGNVPPEEAAEARGDLVWILRNFLGLQTAVVIPSETARREEPRSKDESPRPPR